MLHSGEEVRALQRRSAVVSDETRQRFGATVTQSREDPRTATRSARQTSAPMPKTQGDSADNSGTAIKNCPYQKVRSGKTKQPKSNKHPKTTITMTYLENSKQYTGTDLENIFFRPMLTGPSAQELGVRVLYNMPQPTHPALGRAAQHPPGNSPPQAGREAPPATKKGEDRQPQPRESRTGILRRRLLLDGLRKDHGNGERQHGRPLGHRPRTGRTTLFRQALAENIRATMWIGDTTATSGYNTFDGF